MKIISVNQFSDPVADVSHMLFMLGKHLHATASAIRTSMSQNWTLTQ